MLSGSLLGIVRFAGHPTWSRLRDGGALYYDQANPSLLAKGSQATRAEFVTIAILAVRATDSGKELG